MSNVGAVPAPNLKVLLVDGGQSGCRVALRVDGQIVERSGVPGFSRVGRDWSPLRSLVEQYAVDLVAAGLSGWDGGEVGVPMVVTNDAVTAHLGALGGDAGAVIVAGTGAIALAGNEEGWARADGWGTMLGDAGGGYWIARRALDEALRAFDGRGGSAALLAAATSRFGPLDEIARAVYDAPDPVATVAAFTPDVADLARGGERAAAAIFADAGRELARTVTAALERAGLVGPARGGPARGGPAHGASSPVVVSWSGGVFAAGDLILDPLRAALPAGVELRAPLGDGLDGAARLLDAPGLFSDLIRRP